MPKRAASTHTARREGGRLKPHWQILIALLAAIVVGAWSGPTRAVAGISVYSIFNFVGTLFLNGLQMVMVPLVVSSIIVGMIGIGSSGAVGRLGIKTLVYYLSTSLLAILIGLLMVNLLAPGIIHGQAAKTAIGLSANAGEVLAKVQGRGAGEVVEVFLRMVPTNIVDAAAQGQMLGLIFFSLLFGYFVAHAQEAYAEALHNFWRGVFEVMMLITDWVMKFAPIGVFALVAKVAATTGLAAIKPLLVFFATVLLALALHAFIALPAILKMVARVSPWRHYAAVAPALITAFSSASSSATLPLTMECVEKNAGVSNRTSSFVLPLGATVNMDGTALYECVAAMFIAQAYGLDLTIGVQFTIVAIALLTSIGVAGIPAASLVAIVVILTAIGLPAEGIGLILAVDRLLDMCRTAVNVLSDTCGAVTIAKLEGEAHVLDR